MQVVPRPHRPPTPSVIPQDSTPVGKQDKKDGRSVIFKGGHSVNSLKDGHYWAWH